ncbi:hypothetical protein HDZ31DRAFT_50255 [Schizophyllum fasciatum]
MPSSIVSPFPHWLGAHARRGTSDLSAAPCASSGVGHLLAPSPVHRLSTSPIGAIFPRSGVALHRPLLPIGVAPHRSLPPVASPADPLPLLF